MSHVNWGRYQRDWHINSAYGGRADGKQYAWVFGSGHAGGAFFLMGDGHVKFLSENMDYPTFCWINYIHDNHAVTTF